MAQQTVSCARCGRSLPGGAKFCMSCGAAVVESAPVARQAAAPSPASGTLAPPPNTQRRTAAIWLFISVVGFVGVVAPAALDIDMMSGGGAMGMAGLLVGFTGVAVAIMYFGRARTWERVIGRELLV